MSQALVSGPQQDDVVLTAGGQEIRGWQGVRVTRRAEGIPGDFALEMTERYPGELDQVIVMPGDAFTLSIGGDLVLTGWIDQLALSVSAGAHQVKVTGRGKSCDLVDCSAVIHGMQLSAASALQLAQALAAPFGVTVSGVSGPPIPQFNVNLGETPWEIIDRVARYSQLLVIEKPDGNLLFARVGTTSMGSGFVEGQGAESYEATFSMADRFSEYTAFLLSTDDLSINGTGQAPLAVVKDAGVKRYRPRYIVSEQMQRDHPLAVDRVQWEMARRYGRSQAVAVACDSWRDSAGTLWEPNCLAPVRLPHGRIQDTWVIGEVTYSRGDEGTHAQVSLMPAAAFTPEPTVVQAFDWQTGQALAEARPSLSPADAQYIQDDIRGALPQL